jgi:hypothetical protein
MGISDKGHVDMIHDRAGTLRPYKQSLYSLFPAFQAAWRWHFASKTTQGVV